MKLSEICIRQMVLAIVLSSMLVVLGIVAFQHLELRFFPKLQLPIVTVATFYEGASTELMESQVTTQIENALSSVNHIAAINSTSYSGSSYVTVLFRLGGDFEEEVNVVRDKIFGIRDELPSNANLPTIIVGTKGSPVLGVGFIDSQKSSADIRDYVERTVQPALRQLAGVGEVDILGASDYAMRIWLDASKMVAHQVTVTDIKNALTANNIYFPAGSIQEPKRNFSIVSRTQLKDAKAFGNIIIKHTNDGTVRLNDIGYVKLGYRSLYQLPMRINGQNGIEILIESLQGANPITVAHEIRQSLIQIQGSLPLGMHASVNYDTSTFLKSSIEEAFYTMGEAVILVIIVIFLFLGSARAASIPIVIIPVSLIAVFTFIALLGFTINTMSLLGIVLAIGLVVDDAIVMLENIYRYIEKGMAPLQAAIKGSREITFSVITMALMMMAVYIPVGFVQGFTAELFKEFAFTLAAAVVTSAFIALTLSPMMCSRILLVRTHDSRLVRIIDYLFSQLADRYQRLLKFALIKRRFFVIVLVFIASFGYFLFVSLPSELIPKEDIGLIQISVTSPSGASLNYTDQYVKQIEKIIKQNAAVASVISQVSTSSANIRVALKPWRERKKTTEQVVADLNSKLLAIPGVDATAYAPDIINYGLGGNDIDLNFTITGDYMDLLEPVNKMVRILKQYPGVTDVHTNLKYNTQQYAITIKRDLAAVLGVTIQDIADTVSLMMSGNHWTDVQVGNKNYEVIIQMQKDDLSNFNALRKLYVRNSTSSSKKNMIPISSLINLIPTLGQGNFTHYDRFRSGTVSARLSPGYSESQVINYIKLYLPFVLTSNVHAVFSGKAAQFLESSQSIISIIVMSFVCIYLVLSAQFGSFVDPLIILLVVPLSIVGGLLSLKLTGGTLSIYSQIGLVTLIGMISKHGILVTHFINNLRKQGIAIQDAIIGGAMIRLRPILMTTMTMMFSALPLALATGPGSISRHQIGWVIVGGLLFGTFFSLIIVSIAYSYFARFKKSLTSSSSTH